MRVGDVIDGKYELVRFMGEGGMGEVYKGFHKRINRPVAIKFLHPALVDNAEAVTRIMLEAQTVAIGSEHIVDVIDAGETDDGAPYLVMEFLVGEELRQVLQHERRLDPSRAVSLIIQVCEGLAVAHERGVVHRDVKPENLFLTLRDDGTELVKILDFGIAKFRLSLVGNDPPLTRTGTALGTPCYMAPEQYVDTKNVDQRVDVYSTGVILYELLTGTLPFVAESAAEMCRLVTTTDPRPLRELRPELSEALEKETIRAMSRDADTRHPSMVALAEALAPFCGRAGAVPTAALQPRGPAGVEALDTQIMTAPWPSDSQTGEEPDADEGSLALETASTVEDMAVSNHVFERTTEREEPQLGRGAPRRGWLLFGFGAVVAACCGVLALFLSWTGADPERGSGDPRGRGVAVPPSVSPEPDVVTITLEGVPAGSEIFLDGAAVDGPVFRLRRSQVLRELRVEAADHEPWRRWITPDHDRSYSVSF